MQEHRGLVVAHSENKGVKQVEWGQVVCVLSGFSFAMCIQNKCLNFVFKKLRLEGRLGGSVV